MARDLPRKTDPSLDLGEIELDVEPDEDEKDDFGDTSGSRSRMPVVALAVSDENVLRAAREALRISGYILGASESVSFASVVLVHGGNAVAWARANAQPDAAIIVVLDQDSAGGAAAAHEAGAFACIRYPFVGSELAVLIASALQASKAKVQVADLTRQLDLQSHLASIGRMSAGLSHELGNPLATAMMGLDHVRYECSRLVESHRLLREITQAPVGEVGRGLRAARAHLVEHGEPNDIFAAIDDAEKSFVRMQSVLANLRALVGQATARLEPVDLIALARDARQWAGEALRGVEIEEEGTPLQAMADRTMLGQIILNLLTNAAQAAKGLAAPRLRIHVYASGRHVIVSVRDNGPGIPEELHDKIFEPFFTTRRGKGGTGLGLALCREYARQMGAEISFWSAPGRGACFRIRLRAPETATRTGGASVSPASLAPSSMGRSGPPRPGAPPIAHRPFGGPASVGPASGPGGAPGSVAPGSALPPTFKPTSLMPASIGPTSVRPTGTKPGFRP